MSRWRARGWGRSWSGQLSWRERRRRQRVRRTFVAWTGQAETRRTAVRGLIVRTHPEASISIDYRSGRDDMIEVVIKLVPTSGCIYHQWPLLALLLRDGSSTKPFQLERDHSDSLRRSSQNGQSRSSVTVHKENSKLPQCIRLRLCFYR